MKRIALIIPLCAVKISFGQPFNDSAKTNNYSYYKEKGKRQTITGALMISAGAISTTIGVVSALDHLFEKPSAGATVGFFGGLGLTATGIVFFILSDHSYKKAKKLKMAFKMENAPSLTNGKVSKLPYPGIAVRFGL